MRIRRLARAPRAGLNTGDADATRSSSSSSASLAAASPPNSRMKAPLALRDAARNDEASGSPSSPSARTASVSVSSDRSNRSTSCPETKRARRAGAGDGDISMTSSRSISSANAANARSKLSSSARASPSRWSDGASMTPSTSRRWTLTPFPRPRTPRPPVRPPRPEVDVEVEPLDDVKVVAAGEASEDAYRRVTRLPGSGREAFTIGALHRSAPLPSSRAPPRGRASDARGMVPSARAFEMKWRGCQH